MRAIQPRLSKRHATGLRAIDDLHPSEKRFVAMMSRLRFGRFRNLRIRGGQLQLHPTPTPIREVKFPSNDGSVPSTIPDEFTLKAQVVEFIQQVRSIESGLIQTLVVKGGLPFSMELEEGVSDE